MAGDDVHPDPSHGRYVCFALPFQKGWHTVRLQFILCASPYLFRKDGTLRSLMVVTCASPYLFRKDGTQFGFMVVMCASPYLFRKDGTQFGCLMVVACASPYLFRKEGTQFGFMVRLAVSRVRDIASALSGRHFSFGATSIDSLGRLSSSGHRTCFAWPLLRVGASFRWFRLADPQVRDIACALSNRHFSLGAPSTGSLGRPSSTGHCARFAWPLLQCRGDFL